MQITMNQYITISGIDQYWLPGLFSALESPEAKGKDGKPPSVLLLDGGIRWDEQCHAYTIKLECPLEYTEEKSVYRLSRQGLFAVYTALGLYPEKEKILYGGISKESGGIVDQIVKITGVQPHCISQLFVYCASYRVRSEYHQILNRDPEKYSELDRIKEIVYADITRADWNNEFQTFTVTFGMIARQPFNGKSWSAQSLSKQKKVSDTVGSPGVLFAPRSVVTGMYHILGVYQDAMPDYIDWE